VNERSSVAEQTEHPKAERDAGFAGVDDMPADTRRGGDVRTLLSPKTVGSTSGFMGVATLGPGDRISEHYHPYSEEFIYVVKGKITADLDEQPHELEERHAMLIPINMRHRLRNTGDDEAFIVFHLGPLAPEPHLGHVDTE
jgi:putative monooxygenase